MEKCRTIYKNWVRFLIKKKLYGSWMNDIGAISWYIKNSWVVGNVYNDGNLNLCKESYILERIQNCCADNYLKFEISNLNGFKQSALIHGYRFSNVNWRTVFDEYESVNKVNVLSLSLSRKINRANSPKKYRVPHERVEQPWYNKSYEKRFKNIWKR